jgi:Bacterial antitoxin of type II TA system, VapB
MTSSTTGKTVSRRDGIGLLVVVSNDIATHIQWPINIATMKTTLEIPDPLLREARKIAARERTTLRALVEQGLRRIIADKARKPAFRLRDASFNGRGLNPEFADAGWDRLRDLIYEGRGG